MGLFDKAGAADALEDLYDREFAAAASARFDVLARLADEKSRLTQALVRDGAEPDVLARLERKASRNQALLDAAAKGIRRALARVSAHGQDVPLQTYDRTGRKRPTESRAQALIRKA